MFNFNICSFYLKIYILFISFIFVYNFLAIPFQTINYQYNELSKDYLNKIFSNKIYINITLGTPQQTSKVILKMEKELFYIHKDGFLHNESSSYINLDKDSKSLITIGENKSEDIFYFQFYDSYEDLSNTKNKNQKKIYKNFPMNFILMNYVVIWDSSNKNPGEIGLQYRYANLTDNIIFIKSLKESRQIDNYIFSFIFINDSYKNNNSFNHNGYFVIGEELTDNENEKEKIKYTKASDRNGLIKWDIIFDEIYSYINNSEIKDNKIIINKRHQAQLIIDKPFIVGTDEYESFILENFFQNLIDKNVCFKKNINNDYYCYYCDNSSELFIYSNFPSLNFYSKELDENFFLNKNDLFYYDEKYNNKDEYLSYFMIWFYKSRYTFEKKFWNL